MRAIQFFKESIRNLKSVGTVTQSSKHLCKGMLKHIDFDNSQLIVELGAGDGVITKYILEMMRDDCKLITFEINPNFVDQLNQIKDDRLIIVDDSAEFIGKYINKNGFTKADYIASALPFTLMPSDLTYTIVRACKENLRENGAFIQLHYSLSQRKVYHGVFGNLSLDFVPLNIPPAFVMKYENYLTNGQQGIQD